MKKNDSNGERRLYLGVDIGGTKVQAVLVRESGDILGREKVPIAPQGGARTGCRRHRKSASTTASARTASSPLDLTAIGIAVPGVVDP